MQLLLCVLFAALFARPAFCQDSSFPSNFIKSLIKGDSISQYVLPEELTLSSRLGISYDSVKYKFLISYDIDEDIKNRIKRQQLDYTLDLETLGDGFSKIIFSIPAEGYKRQYFSKESRLISPPYYYSHKWKRVESTHFVFYVSSPDLLNNYSISKLEDFIDLTTHILEYTPHELKELENKKIYYFLCRDEIEVEQLTGYKARGNYILAYDYIVTSYNCHYHELVHLLVNNKLNSLPLYTHPFFQEGIAAALGGRGGYEKEIVKRLGYFIQQSGFGDYKSLLSYSDFQGTDPSFSYPISGLYNSFLVLELGAKRYLNLYKKYSGDISAVNNTTINIKDLPADSLYLYSLSSFPANDVKPFMPAIDGIVFQKSANCIISGDEENIIFKTKGNILIKTEEPSNNYKSNLFNEEVKDRVYNGEKYFIKVSGTEISLYNLYTNNLIAHYAAGFSPGMESVQIKEGYFCFTIAKRYFEENLRDAIISW